MPPSFITTYQFGELLSTESASGQEGKEGVFDVALKGRQLVKSIAFK